MDRANRVAESKQEKALQESSVPTSSKVFTKQETEQYLDKMANYEKTWRTRDRKHKEQQLIKEKELESYFQPHVSSCSKKLALRRKAKNGLVVTGGKTFRNNTTVFDKLYSESKQKKETFGELTDRNMESKCRRHTSKKK